MPYLVYLARGRDAEKPAIIVLLDSDKDGDDAKRDLGRNGPHPRKKQVLHSDFILQLGDIQTSEVESIVNGTSSSEVTKSLEKEFPFRVLEDLVPLPMTIRAVQKFIKTVYDVEDKDLKWLSNESVLKAKHDNDSFFKTIQSMLREHCQDSNIHIDKVPFARTVVDLLPEIALEREIEPKSSESSGLSEFEYNMRTLFSRLAKMRVLSEKSGKDKRMRQKVSNKIKTFLSDHSIRDTALRDEASSLLEDIQSDLEGDDAERTFIIQTCIELRAEHKLTEDLYEPIRDYSSFVNGLEKLENAKDYAYPHTPISVSSLKPESYDKELSSGSSTSEQSNPAKTDKQPKAKAKKSSATKST